MRSVVVAAALIMLAACAPETIMTNKDQVIVDAATTGAAVEHARKQCANYDRKPYFLRGNFRTFWFLCLPTPDNRVASRGGKGGEANMPGVGGNQPLPMPKPAIPPPPAAPTTPPIAAASPPVVPPHQHYPVPHGFPPGPFGVPPVVASMPRVGPGMVAGYPPGYLPQPGHAPGSMSAGLPGAGVPQMAPPPIQAAPAPQTGYVSPGQLPPRPAVAPPVRLTPLPGIQPAPPPIQPARPVQRVERPPPGSAFTERIEGDPPISEGGGSSGHWVQISASRTRDTAISTGRRIVRDNRDLFGSRSLSVVRANVRSAGVYYRARVGPFSTAFAAHGACNSLKKRRQDCFVVSR